MSITINCAVDSGYGYSLGQSSISEVIISNFIKKLDEDSALRLAESIDKPNNKGVIIKYDNNYYVIGNLATKADPSLKRHAINDRVNNTTHLVEILSTLGLLCDSKCFNANLIVGLPNKLRENKKAMALWLKKEWKFSYLTKNGAVDKIINIENVAVIEQPVAAIYNLDQDEIDNMTVISCDVGHGTVDGCVMTEGILSVNTKDWVSIEGVKRCYEGLKNKLLKQYQKDCGMYDILEKDLQLAIETGYFKMNKKNVNITEYLNEVLEDYAEYISSELADKYADYLANADYVIASGGMMNNEYFTNKLTENLKQNKVQLAFFDDPQKSIVHGMFNMVNDLYEDDFTESEVAATAQKDTKKGDE